MLGDPGASIQWTFMTSCFFSTTSACGRLGCQRLRVCPFSHSQWVPGSARWCVLGCALSFAYSIRWHGKMLIPLGRASQIWWNKGQHGDEVKNEALESDDRVLVSVSPTSPPLPSIMTSGMSSLMCKMRIVVNIGLESVSWAHDQCEGMCFWA